MTGTKIRICVSVGGGVLGENLANALRRQGFDCQLDFGTSIDDYWKGKSKNNKWPLRWAMYVKYPLAICLRTLFFEREIQIVGNSPFYLPLLLALAGRIRGHTVIQWLLDTYPDCLIVGGAVRRGSLTDWLVSLIVKAGNRATTATVFLGEKLQQYAERKYGGFSKAVAIPIGSDDAAFKGAFPQAESATIDRADAIRIMYSGHFGRMHESATLLKALASLDQPDLANSSPALQFQISLNADGPVLEKIRKNLQPNSQNRCELSGLLPSQRCMSIRVEFGSTLKKDQWVQAMQGAAIALVTMQPGAEVVVMPSKTYSAMLAGQAILAICPLDSDLAVLILENKAGWVVTPESTSQYSLQPRSRVYHGSKGLLQLLEHLALYPEEILQARRQAFDISHSSLGMDVIAKEWRSLLVALGGSTRGNP